MNCYISIEYQIFFVLFVRMELVLSLVLKQLSVQQKHIFDQ